MLSPKFIAEITGYHEHRGIDFASLLYRILSYDLQTIFSLDIRCAIGIFWVLKAPDNIILSVAWWSSPVVRVFLKHIVCVISGGDKHEHELPLLAHAICRTRSSPLVG